MRRTAVAVVAVLVVVLATAIVPAEAAIGTCGTAPAPETVSDADGWPLPNRDLVNGRAQLDTRIGSDTVDELELVWRYPVPGNALFGNLTTNPVVVDGTVYVGALDGSAHALDLLDGTQRWAVPRHLSVFGPAGVTVGWGKVFGITGQATAVAHDAADGSVRWTTNLRVANGNQIDAQPMLVGGCVLISTQALVAGSRGTLYALDQADGHVVWQVETVPDDFWGDPVHNHGGGSWYPPTVDLGRQQLYWGTSNPWPAPGTTGFPAGSSRPGDNLYTNSALALDLADGSMAWFHQVFPHDIWDRDMVLTQLVDLPGGGDVVVHTGKGGRVLGYDPDTGAVRWDVPVGRHQNDELTTFTGPITVMPGVLGGVETPPAAADGVVYVAVVNAPTPYRGPEQSFALNPQLGTYPSDLVAIDASDGSTLWSAAIPGDALGGATVVGDLVFTSTFQGLLLAYDRTTGQEVWRYDAGAVVNGWPAVVGDTIIFPVSGSDPSELLAFRLPPAPPEPTSTTTTATAGPGPTDAPTTATSSPADPAGAPGTEASPATAVAADVRYAG